MLIGYRIAVTIGVVLHLPMFWMGRDSGFRLADMPMDAEMLWGMALIVAGIALGAFAAARGRPESPSGAMPAARLEDAP